MAKWQAGWRACAAISVAVILGTGTARAETLKVLWTRSLYPAEDVALKNAITAFEAATGATVELSQYQLQDMIPKTLEALAAGAPPDVAYADAYDFQVTGKWAFDGRLEDLSDILLPLKPRFAPNTLETTYLLNGRTGNRAYYAFPLKQQTIHVNYWKDMLDSAGIAVSDIPTRWDDYWAFWCNRVQGAVRKTTGQRIYGVGMPMGVESTDSLYSFLTFLDAYDVKLVDDQGELLVDDPKVRDGLIRALTQYVAPVRAGCAPASATNWRDPDNNIAFSDRVVAMTLNPTISIAAKWLEDSLDERLTPARRAAARTNYERAIVTSGFPDKPDGTKMVYRASVKTGVVFSDARHKALAKQFVAFLLRDENLTPYVEGALGRWFPVTVSGQESPFWQADAHRRAVYDQFKAGTVTFEFTKNHRLTIANNENVWAVAMNRVVNEDVPVETAVDEMIARIKDVAQ